MGDLGYPEDLEETSTCWSKIARLAKTANKDVTIHLSIDKTIADVVSALESEEGQEALRKVEEGK